MSLCRRSYGSGASTSPWRLIDFDQWTSSCGHPGIPAETRQAKDDQPSARQANTGWGGRVGWTSALSLLSTR